MNKLKLCVERHLIWGEDISSLDSFSRGEVEMTSIVYFLCELLKNQQKLFVNMLFESITLYQIHPK